MRYKIKWDILRTLSIKQVPTEMVVDRIMVIPEMVPIEVMRMLNNRYGYSTAASSKGGKIKVKVTDGSEIVAFLENFVIEEI